MVQSNHKYVIKASGIPASFELTWANISLVPVANPANVSDWNTFFNLPAMGNSFTSVVVDGDVVHLIGGSNILIDNILFYGNSALVKVKDTANSIVGVKNGSFYSCGNLTEVSLPVCTSTYTTPASTPIGSFMNCTSLVIADFPAALDIGDRGFSNCTNLINVNFPSLTLARNYAFASTGLISPSFPSLDTAYIGAFSSNYNLTNPSFPNLQAIWSGCFANDSSLVDLTLPSVSTIGDQVFWNCVNLTTLHIEPASQLGTTVLNDSVFYLDASMMDLYVNISLQTCNAGNPDGDITYLQGIAPGVTIHYVA